MNDSTYPKRRPATFCVGRYVGSMGDTARDGEPVILDAARAEICEDGVTRIPVVSHACVDPDCHGNYLWDDGRQIHINACNEQTEDFPGACCVVCGSTFNTETKATV